MQEEEKCSDRPIKGTAHSKWHLLILMLFQTWMTINDWQLQSPFTSTASYAIQWKWMETETVILLAILFHISPQNDTHTGFEQHGGESIMTTFIFLSYPTEIHKRARATQVLPGVLLQDHRKGNRDGQQRVQEASPTDREMQQYPRLSVR